MDERTFTTNEISRITGVSLRQLQWWDERGLISPKQWEHQRHWTGDELLGVSLAFDMRKRGISLQKIRRLLPRIISMSAEVAIIDAAGRKVRGMERENVLDALDDFRAPVYIVLVQRHRRIVEQWKRKRAA